MDVRIVTDSAADLPARLVDAHRITVVPLTVRFGDESFLDGVELSAPAFWDRWATSTALPETAAPGPGQFESAFRRLAGDGADAVVYVGLSGAMSGTVQSATVAARAVADVVPVTVVDSRSVSLGQGLVAVVAAEAAAATGRLDAVVDRARGAVAATRVWAVLDTLDHLRRGGRIGGARALLASVLAIKPVIVLRDGAVEEGGRPRTRSRALARLLDEVRADLPLERLGVVHSGPASVDEFVATLRSVTGLAPVVAPAGPVVGAHAGPGMVGLAYERRVG